MTEAGTRHGGEAIGAAPGQPDVLEIGDEAVGTLKKSALQWPW